MRAKKLNDFTPQPPPDPGARIGWQSFPATVEFPADEEQEDGDKEAPKS